MAYLSVMLCLASVLVTLLLSNQAVHSPCLFADRQFLTQVGQYSSIGIFVNGLNGRLDNGAIIFDEGDKINFIGKFNREEEATSFNLGDYTYVLIYLSTYMTKEPPPPLCQGVLRIEYEEFHLKLNVKR